jgi:hypothetical protein
MSASYLPRIDLSNSPTLYDYVISEAFFSGVMGPVGSGKSVASCAKIMYHAMRQEPSRDNIRRTRWAIIRNTNPELRSTTIKTWQDLYPPESCGDVIGSSPIQHVIEQPPQGGQPGWRIEVLFIALDRPGDIKKLKSLDLTGAWINEAIEIPEQILTMLTGRVGRYPGSGNFAGGSNEDVGATWAGIFADTNACDDTNWWYDLAEGKRKIDVADDVLDGVDLSWQFWRQPPAVLEVKPSQDGYVVAEKGMAAVEIEKRHVFTGAGRSWTINPGAENIANLRASYYPQQIGNASFEYIQRMLQAKYVYITDGKAVVPEFDQASMVRDLPFDPNLDLIGGIDIGGGTLNPALVVGQRGQQGDWRVLAELCGFSIGLDRFGELIHGLLGAPPFNGARLSQLWCDPASAVKDPLHEIQIIQHLRNSGLAALPAPTNDPIARREALVLPMNRVVRNAAGTSPGFLVHRRCQMLIAGLAGKWNFRRMQVSGSPMYQQKPDKNRWSHVCEATEYMVSGGGEHRIFELGGSAAMSRQKFRGAAQPGPRNNILANVRPFGR